MIKVIPVSDARKVIASPIFCYLAPSVQGYLKKIVAQADLIAQMARALKRAETICSNSKYAGEDVALFSALIQKAKKEVQ